MRKTKSTAVPVLLLALFSLVLTNPAPSRALVPTQARLPRRASRTPKTIPHLSILQRTPFLLEFPQAEIPNDQNVQNALIRWLKENAARIGNIKPQNLKVVYVHKVVGKSGISDMFYAYFKQEMRGSVVEESHLNFSIQIINDKPVVTSVAGDLFPDLSLPSEKELAQEDIQSKAMAAQIEAVKTLGEEPGADNGQSRPMGRSVRYLGDPQRNIESKFRVVEEIYFPDHDILVAVDVNTGDQFPSQDRAHAQEATEPSGNVSGWVNPAEDSGKDEDVKHLVKKPLKDLLVKTGLKDFAAAAGVATDENGDFQTGSDKAAPVEAGLQGKYGEVKNSNGENLKFTGKTEPGKVLKIEFNSAEAQEIPTAQTNGYYHAQNVLDYVVSQGVPKEPLVKKPLTINVNEPGSGNAWYSRWDHSINFLMSDEQFNNTALPDVINHEFGHNVDDSFGGIRNGGLSEAWGDILAMFITRQPVIGKFFFKANKNGIRNGTNTYKYKENDEVHKQGEAFMGFAWKLFVSLIKPLGLEQALAKTAALVVPVIVSNAADIPAAIDQVILRARQPDGSFQFLDQILAAAKVHGIRPVVPEVVALIPAAGISQRIAAWLSDWLKPWFGKFFSA